MSNPVTEFLTRDDLIKSERDLKKHLREVQKWANDAELKLVKKTTRIRELEKRIAELEDKVKRTQDQRDFALMKGYEFKKDAERYRKARELDFDGLRRLAALSPIARDEAIDAMREGEG